MKAIVPHLLLTLVVYGCSHNDLPKPFDCDANPIVMDLISSTDTECGLLTGAIEVTASGGSGTYQYAINDSGSQTHGAFAGLASGKYTVTATDDQGCIATIDITIVNREGLNIEVQTTASGCAASGGSVTANPVQGVAPIHYKINAESFQDQNTFQNLEQGDYTITAMDATGCEVSQRVHVPSGVGFASQVSSIVEANCSITGCHNGTQPPDFRSFQTIREFASLIRVQVVTRTMPVDGSLTQSEINTILCWIDDGAPAN